jgi:hypothetical protein
MPSCFCTARIEVHIAVAGERPAGQEAAAIATSAYAG